MPAPRRQTLGVEVGEGIVLSEAEVSSVYTAVLTPLRADSRRVDADLLPRKVLPPDARQAALTLRDLGRGGGLNPFSGVELNPQDEAQWAALLVIARYAPELTAWSGRWTILWESAGDLNSLRLELLPRQVVQVEAHLAGLALLDDRHLRLRPR